MTRDARDCVSVEVVCVAEAAMHLPISAQRTHTQKTTTQTGGSDGHARLLQSFRSESNVVKQCIPRIGLPSPTVTLDCHSRGREAPRAECYEIAQLDMFDAFLFQSFKLQSAQC